MTHEQNQSSPLPRIRLGKPQLEKPRNADCNTNIMCVWSRGRVRSYRDATRPRNRKEETMPRREEKNIAAPSGSQPDFCCASSIGSLAWRRKAPDVEGFWWLGWSSTTNYRGLRHEWHTAREYLTRQQIKCCKFPEHGWYAPAVGAHETEPPAMPENGEADRRRSEERKES